MALAALFALASPLARAADPDGEPGASADSLLSLVKQFNPELAAAALDREQAVANIGPAGAFDDPMVNVTRDEGFRQTIVSVSQEFPLWGKRGLRRDVARAGAQGAQSKQDSVARDLAERVKVTFAQYYEAAHAVQITHEIQAFLRTVSATARARYGQGLVTQSDAIRAELEQARLDAEIAMLEQSERSAAAKINALIGRHANAPLAQPMVLRGLPPAPALAFDDLMTRARSSNPMLAMSKADIAAAEGERKLVDKSWYPDLTITVGGDALPGQSVRPMAGVGLKVPLQWGVRDAQAQAANAKRGAAQLRFDAATLQIESDLEGALAVLNQAERTEDLVNNTLTPQSDAAYRSALSSYQLGKGDLTSILDAARQQLEIRRQLLRTQTDAQTALAAIERLIGDDL
jgi:outer membrane protein TolC